MLLQNFLSVKHFLVRYSRLDIERLAFSSKKLLITLVS
jgi:hypothetical protein